MYQLATSVFYISSFHSIHYNTRKYTACGAAAATSNYQLAQSQRHNLNSIVVFCSMLMFSKT